jgi:hypothetical protein
MARIDEMAKAIFGGIIAALTAAGTALSVGDGSVTAEGWVAIAVAFFSTFSTVYFVPNAERPPKQIPIYIGHEEDEELYDTRTSGLNWDRGEGDATD